MHNRRWVQNTWCNRPEDRTTPSDTTRTRGTHIKNREEGRLQMKGTDTCNRLNFALQQPKYIIAWTRNNGCPSKIEAHICTKQKRSKRNTCASMWRGWPIDQTSPSEKKRPQMWARAHLTALYQYNGKRKGNVARQCEKCDIQRARSWD